MQLSVSFELLAACDRFESSWSAPCMAGQEARRQQRCAIEEVKWEIRVKFLVEAVVASHGQLGAATSHCALYSKLSTCQVEYISERYTGFRVSRHQASVQHMPFLGIRPRLCAAHGVCSYQ